MTTISWNGWRVYPIQKSVEVLDRKAKQEYKTEITESETNQLVNWLLNQPKLTWWNNQYLSTEDFLNRRETWL